MLLILLVQQFNFDCLLPGCLPDVCVGAVHVLVDGFRQQLHVNIDTAAHWFCDNQLIHFWLAC
jgi:hypothetical protein